MTHFEQSRNLTESAPAMPAIESRDLIHGRSAIPLRDFEGKDNESPLMTQALALVEKNPDRLSVYVTKSKEALLLAKIPLEPFDTGSAVLDFLADYGYRHVTDDTVIGYGTSAGQIGFHCLTDIFAVIEKWSRKNDSLAGLFIPLPLPLARP